MRYNDGTLVVLCDLVQRDDRAIVPKDTIATIVRMIGEPRYNPNGPHVYAIHVVGLGSYLGEFWVTDECIEPLANLMTYFPINQQTMQ